MSQRVCPSHPIERTRLEQIRCEVMVAAIPGVSRDRACGELLVPVSEFWPGTPENYVAVPVVETQEIR